jgi:predicted phage terminase large subunit-like protein
MTTEGWKNHGDLKVGDKVFGVNGNPVEILWTSEKAEADMRVTFSNGEQIECHENHEWTVYDRSSNMRKWRTLETKWFIGTNRNGKKRSLKIHEKTGKSRNIYQLPNIEPLQFEEKKLPLDPYILGTWLGDGSVGKPCITHSIDDKEGVKYVASQYPISVAHRHENSLAITTSFAKGSRGGIPSYFSRDLKYIGVLNDKHIPKDYIFSSIPQRLQLLAGLIDTDGHVDKTSRVSFSTTSESLRDGVYKIVLSLGLRPYVMEQDPVTSTSGIIGRKKVYTIGFQPTFDIPTKIPRKKITRTVVQRRIGIESVERIENPKKGKCIQVDSEDGLYLVGKKLIPTHNSEGTSFWFPSWYLSLFPENRLILASYGDTFASKWGRKVRDQLETVSEDIVKIRRDKSAANNWMTTEGGGMRSVGVGGAVTGDGGNCIIIDDPHKDWEEALSPTYRRRVVDWFNATLYTRLEPNASLVVIQTRWHESDLTGYLLNDHTDEWEHINLPALAEENDPLGREIGEALCPERYTKEDLEKIKKGVGSQIFAGLYQQRPAPAEGGTIKRDYFMRYDVLPLQFDEMLHSWDLNFEEDGTSYVVDTVWGRKGGNYYLVDVFREKIGFPATLKAFDRMGKKYPDARTKLVEKKANGHALVATVKDKIPGVIPITPKGSKIARLVAVSCFFESGNVYVPHKTKDTLWVEDFIEELCTFPNAKNDDQVDSASMALSRLGQKTSVFDISLPGGNNRPSPWSFES